MSNGVKELTKTKNAAVKKMSGIEEISTLMNSRRRAILAHTFEEERFQEDLKTIVEAKGQEAFAWTITSGLTDIVTGLQVQKIYDPVKIMDFIDNYDKTAVFIIKDFHDIWTNFSAKRRLRDVLEKSDDIYKPILLVSPQVNIPMELEKIITMVTYDLPTREHVEEQLVGMEEFLKSKDLPLPEGRERVAVINAMVGMTHSEMVNVLKKSVAKHKKISLEEIVAEKEQVIKKTGLLEYITKLGNMANVGGMDILKDWFNDAYYAFDHEAREYGIDPVRGTVVAGFPGTGKSLTAKSVAHQWNLPLLKMNMSDIMDSKVGQSEKNIDRALKLAESVSPCVLWIDEFEKALAGMSSSDKSDGGTTSRVIQSLLTWLSDKDAPVFVIATANDITKLPAELTRAGRFDDIFFVSLPAQQEREEIFKIHLGKRGYELCSFGETLTGNCFTEAQISELATKSTDFTGAEIEQVVSEAGRRAYAAFRKKERESHYIRQEDILEQIEKIVPLSKRNPDLLSDLRNWAKHSAKCASSEEHTLIHGAVNTKAKLVDLDFPDVEFN
jgi:hypothetical protein